MLGIIRQTSLAALTVLATVTGLLAQPSVSIDQGDTIYVPCGEQLQLSATHSGGTALQNNFNNSTAGVGWVTTAGALFTNPCGANPLSNNTYMWMGPATPHPRSLTSVPLNLACGGQICFHLKFAQQGVFQPCEGPDLPNEGVHLEWSTNGINWFKIYYFNPDTVCCGCGAGGCGGNFPSPFLTWTNYCFNIPPAAMTAATQIRWIQKNSSTNNFDHWGIDEVEIQNNCAGDVLFWSNGDTTDTILTAPIVSSGTMIATLTDGVDSTSDTIVVIAQNPVFDVVASEDTVCPGVAVTLQIDTQNASYLASGINYNYSWFPNTLVTNSTSLTTNATINFPTTLIATMIHPNFPVCSSQDTVNIHVENTLFFNNATVADENCGNANGGISDGELMVDVGGGSGVYGYNFNNTGFTGNNMQAGLPEGTYSVQVVDSLKNCYIDTTLTVNLIPGLNLETIFINDVSCKDFCDAEIQTDISGEIGTPTFFWNGIGQTGPNLDTVVNVCAGPIQLAIQDDHCTYVHNFTVEEPDSLLVQLDLSSPKICMRENANLVATVTGGTQPYEYFWSNLPSVSGHSVSPDIPTEYSLYVADSNGCVTDTMKRTLDVFPPITTYSTNDTVCPDADATVGVTALGGNGNFNYIWSGNVTDQPSYTVAGQFESSFFVTVDDNCVWPVIDTVFIDLFPMPDPKFEVLLEDPCVPADVQFSFNGTRVREVSWDFGNGMTTEAISTKMNNTYTAGGAYPVTLSITSTDDCFVEHTQAVEVYEPPVAMFSWDETREYDILNNVVQMVNESENATIYEWILPDGETTDLLNPSIELEQRQGRYFIDLVAYNDQGCVDRHKESIFLLPRIAFWMPNSFTPNDDGVNDDLVPHIDGIMEDTYTLVIYNRWGAKVFESNDPSESWDGVGAPDGAYIWKVSFKNLLNDLIKEQGTVQILR